MNYTIPLYATASRSCIINIIREDADAYNASGQRCLLTNDFHS